MQARAAGLETAHTARAPMPGARGEDEDYSHSQSQLAQGIESIHEQTLRGFRPHAILNMTASLASGEGRSHSCIQSIYLARSFPVLYWRSNLPENRFSHSLETKV